MKHPFRAARSGLGAYLAFAFSLLSALVTLVLMLVSEHTAGAQVSASIGANLAELAHQTASRLDRSLYERHREIRLLAVRLGSLHNPADARQALDTLQDSYPQYAWLGLTDMAGKVVASSRGLLTGVEVGARPWFRDALQGRHVLDVHEAQLLAKLLSDPTGEPPRFVDLAFPVVGADGRPRGVLGAHLHWRWARDIEDAIFAQVARSRKVDPLIVSAGGSVLLGPQALRDTSLALESLAAARRGASGYQVERWPDGREYLVGFSQTRGYLDYPGLGWTVLVRQDLREAYAPVAQLRYRLLGWGLVVALAFSLLGWVLARGITRPLLALADNARAIETGQTAVVVPSAAYQEVQSLGRALNALVDKLQHNEAALRELNTGLEERVQERTTELRDAFARVEQNERRTRTIIESAQDPFIGVDFDGRITDWNSQAEQLFGWRRDEILGRSLARTLLPERHASAMEAAMMDFLASGEQLLTKGVTEHIMVTRDGREIAVEVRIGLVDTGTQKFFSAFVHDISQRKEMERLKDEFISTVSHELRTPLTAIHGSLSLLNAGMGGELPDDARELLRICGESCDRLVRLVNDVLDAEKFHAGQMRHSFSPQPLLPLVETAVRSMLPHAESRHLVLTLQAQPPGPVVSADAERLIQVVVNLLSNALKFSPDGGSVRVLVEVAGSSARVSVTDHGPGVPQEFRPRIFERFAQADGSDRRARGGTGLGLSICHAIVTAHGGRIGFASEPGVETVFYFELPLA